MPPTPSRRVRAACAAQTTAPRAAPATRPMVGRPWAASGLREGLSHQERRMSLFGHAGAGLADAELQQAPRWLSSARRRSAVPVAQGGMAGRHDERAPHPVERRPQDPSSPLFPRPRAVATRPERRYEPVVFLKEAFYDFYGLIRPQFSGKFLLSFSARETVTAAKVSRNLGDNFRNNETKFGRPFRETLA